MHLSGNLPPGYSFPRFPGQVNGAVTLANLASSGASQRRGFKGTVLEGFATLLRYCRSHYLSCDYQEIGGPQWEDNNYCVFSEMRTLDEFVSSTKSISSCIS